MATGSAESLRPQVKFTPQIERNDEASIRYYKWGDTTPLGVVTKIHGDEQKVGGPTAHCLVGAAHFLRGFAFIDRGSPTAVVLGRESNGWGNNVNRHFWEPPTDLEVKCLMAIHRRHAPFETIVVFHEDEGRYPVGHAVKDDSTPFSMYHYGAYDPWLQLNDLRARVNKLGVTLRNGIDVSLEEDPALGYHFDDGYNYTRHKELDGTIDVWAVNSRLAKRSYTVEIPMWLPRIVKTALCQAVFDCVILTNPLLVQQVHTFVK